MMQELKENSKSVIVVLTAFLFLNMSVYLPNEGFFPLPAYIIDLSIFIFLVGYYIKKSLLFPLGNILFIWVLFFFVLNLIYYLFSPMSLDETGRFKVMIFIVFVYLYTILLLALDDKNLTMMRKSLVFISPIIVLTLGIDYVNPGYFSFNPTYIIVEGRAASFYRNSNYAGTSLMIILILGIDIIPKKSRFFFLLIIFLGLLFTMSRSNIITFFIIVLFMSFQKKLYLRQVISSISIIAILFIWLSMGGLETIAQKYDLKVTDNMKSRINFFTDNADSDTHDMDERKEILHDALNIFQDYPIFGKGFGATLFWDNRVGPHNTIAMLLADHGVFGLLLFLSLLYFSTQNIFKYGEKEQKELAILFIVTYSLSCLFSHDRLTQTTAIIFIVALSTIGYKMKKLVNEQ